MAEAMLALVFVGGWVVMYVVIRRVVFAEVEQLRADVYEHTRMEAKAAAAPNPAAVAPPVVAPAPAPKSDEISVETLAVISAAVAAFLGARARVRHARMLPAYGTSPWAQQGRVFIQASHNLWAGRSRG